MNETGVSRKPFFYDVTLRDGNQALKKPWNIKEKEIVFKALLELGVQGIEVGFAAASDMDFDAVKHLASLANDKVVVSTLARAKEYDINKAYEAIKDAKKPRIHTFIALSPFAMKYVLKKDPKDVQKIAVEMVAYAKSLLGEKGEVQFSAEHFGDSLENLDFVIETFEKVIEAGASIINLPNTVERYRVSTFVNMVKRVVERIGDKAIISVHCHNDLGQATATTVESFFAGATQLEVTLNGLGERAGNTNLYEVAVSLYNCGVPVDLNFSKIYETALLVEELSGVPICEKAPLIGRDALAHRSGIHQDGSIKTKNMKKGAYRPIDPEFIGRKGEILEFTSQSGKSAIYEILSSHKWPITIEEATYLQPVLKKKAEEKGALDFNDIVEEYKKHILNVDGPFKVLEFKELHKEDGNQFYFLKLQYNDKIIKDECVGDGPIDAFINLLNSHGFNLKLEEFAQEAFDIEQKGSSAQALTTIKLKNLNTGKSVIARGMDPDTREANIKAIVNGLNLLFREK